MSESTRSGASGVLRLTLAQLPLMLRSFFRQKALVFWTYGFSVLVLFFACTILAGMAGSGDVLRPPLASAVMMLTVMCAGLFGVSQGVWEFFGGGTLERYRRAPCGRSSVWAFCTARYLVILSAGVLQLLLLRVVYGISTWAGLGVLLLVLVLATVSFVALGLACATVVRARHQTLVLANFLFIVLIGTSLVTMADRMARLQKQPLPLPNWAVSFCRLWPSAQTYEALESVTGAAAKVGEIGGALVSLVLFSVVVIGVVAWRFDWLALNRGAEKTLEG